MPVSPHYVYKTNTVCGHFDRRHAANGMCNACYCHSRFIHHPKKPRLLTDADVAKMIGECQHKNPKQSGTTKCEKCYRMAYKRVPEVKKRNQMLAVAKHEQNPAPRRENAKRHYVKEKSTASAYRHHLKRRYGITVEQYQEMMAAQNGKCAICECEQSRKGRFLLDVDHNHSTGDVRALLCNHCNIGLGHFKDDLTLLMKAMNYLRKFEKGTNNPFLSEVA